MRIQALSLLILATLISTVTANDEVKRLMADLSFGDAIESDAGTSVAETAKPATQPALPLASEKVATEKVVTEKVVTEKAPLVSNSEAFPAVSGLDAAQQGSQLPPKAAPKAVLKDPVPDVAPKADINLSRVVEASSPEVARIRSVEHKSVGHRKHNSDCEPLTYKTGIVCRPQVSPSLPTSTFVQYFRGSPCYSHVWDGYRSNCGSHHARLHSNFDCFKAKNSGCESCNSGKRK